MVSFITEEMQFFLKIDILPTFKCPTGAYNQSLKSNRTMAIVKVIEVIASSENGVDDAIRSAVAEVSKTVRNIDSVYVKDIKAHVKDGQVTTFGLVCQISFRVDD
jgi:flavin-binding protein dodecin